MLKFYNLHCLESLILVIQGTQGDQYKARLTLITAGCMCGKYQLAV